VTLSENKRDDPARAARYALGPELLERLLDHLHTRIDGCLGAGLSASAPKPHSLYSVGIAAELDALQWEVDDGPLVRATTEQEATVTAQLADEQEWPRLAEAMAARTTVSGPIAALTVAGSWNDEGPIVLSVYLDHQPNSHDLRAVEEIEPVLAMAAALVEFCSEEVVRSDQLLAMVEHRRIIEQAKGMVMAARGCDGGTAFRLLVTTSQHFNVKLRELSTATVELVGQAPAESAGADGVKGIESLATPPSAARDAAQRMWAALRD
jgi:hypothetical protein